MDAKAYLTKQGWRGSGHSLDHSNRGITRPLLVSKKVDVLGLGLNKHAAVSDQWWLRAFDQGLKTLGTGQESALAQAQKHGVNRGGLYARFVKGEGVAGTFEEGEIEQKEEPAADNSKWKPVDMDQPSGKKRKRGDEEREEKRAKRKADRAVRAKKNHVKDESQDGAKDSPSEKKAKKLAKEERREVMRAKKKAHKAAKSEMKLAASRGEKRDSEAAAAKKAKREEARRAKEAKKATKEDGFNTGADEITLNGAPKVNGDKTASPVVKPEKALKPEKLAAYTKRAAEKGITLEDYIRRRDEKTAEKSSQKSLASLGVIVDTAGAEDPQSAIITSNAKEPVPLDPSLWEGKKVKDLPRDVREARRQWMRQGKKARGPSNQEKEKTRAQVKHKERSIQQRALLAAVATATGPTVKLKSGKEYQTWTLEGKDGHFTENDKAMARRQVRHGAKVEKQIQKRGATGERSKKNNRNRAKNREKYRKKSEVRGEKGVAK